MNKVIVVSYKQLLHAFNKKSIWRAIGIAKRRVLFLVSVSWRASRLFPHLLAKQSGHGLDRKMPPGVVPPKLPICPDYPVFSVFHYKSRREMDMYMAHTTLRATHNLATPLSLSLSPPKPHTEQFG